MSLGTKLLNNLTKLRFTAATIILPFILSGALPADIPAGYYDDAEGKVGAELKAALHDIIKGHVEFPYTSSSTDVWDILKKTDRDPNNSDNVILLYTGRSQEKEYQDHGSSVDYTQYDNGNGTYNDSWNREHVWAKSHGDFGTANGAGTDVHHIRPADRSVNSDRSNLDFDNGGGPHVEATGCRYDSDSWEPRDAVKGDVARMIFYMAVRYEGDNGEPDLEVVDYVTNWGYPDYPKYPIHGKLSTLLEWHFDDPVDDWERNRNDSIFTYQRNRNPFIDSSGFVTRIWIDTTGQSGNSNLFFSEYIDDYSLYPCYPNPFNPTTTIQYDLFKETTVTLRIYDLRGIVVNTLVKEKQGAGIYRVLWNGSTTGGIPVAAGVYLYRMQTDDGFSQTGKMILLK
jgi:endonuclease I